jgi:hypothetical protein
MLEHSNLKPNHLNPASAGYLFQVIHNLFGQASYRQSPRPACASAARCIAGKKD